MRAGEETGPAPAVTARRAAGRCSRWTQCWSWPVVNIPAGRVPGTRRAARGRSRAPVANTTVRASTSRTPVGPVTSARPGAAHPVTIVRVLISTPQATARSTHRRAYTGPARTRRKSRTPKPVCSHSRGVPPASSSRSTTTTVPAPPDFSAVAAAKPAGPAPTTRASTVTTSRRMLSPRRQAGRDRSSAIEALTSPVGRPRAPAQATEVDGRDRGTECVSHFALGDTLTEAHDVPIGRIALDHLGIFEGSRRPLRQLGHVRHDRLVLGLHQREPAGPHLLDHVLGDGERRGQTGRPDAPGAGIVLTFMDADLVVRMLRGRAQARIDRGHLPVDQIGQDSAARVQQAVDA